MTAFLLQTNFLRFANGGFEHFNKGAVGVGGFVFGAFDIADVGGDVVVGDGDGTQEAVFEVDIFVGHEAVVEGDVVVFGDHFFDGFKFIGTQGDVWGHAFEGVADAAVVFNEFVTPGDVGLCYGFFDGDAVGIPVRGMRTNVEDVFIIKEWRKGDFRTLDVVGGKKNAQRGDAGKNSMVDFLAFIGVDGYLKRKRLVAGNFECLR